MIFILLCLSLLGIGPPVAGHILPGARKLSMRAPYYTTKALATASTAVLPVPTRVSNGFHNSSLHHGLSQGRLTLVTAPPASSTGLGNYRYTDLGMCSPGNQTCVSANPIQPTTEDLSDQCLLWDSSCSGNKTLALNQFFNETIANISGNECFTNLTCDYHPAGRAEVYDQIRKWMHSPQCVSSGIEFGKMNNVTPPWEVATSSGLPGSCCGSCELGIGNVDVYYWPEPDADTSCLSIIGDSINPVDLGATTVTNGGPTYWGCSAKTPITTADPELAVGMDSPGGDVFVLSIVTTAVLIGDHGMNYKQSLFNPWSPQAHQLCIETSSTSKPSGVSTASQAMPRSIHARGRSLSVRSITEENGLPVSTVVSGQFTFTSPSIYAQFYDINAIDMCGQTTVPTTMLSFSPGELSTIAEPIVGNWNLPNFTFSTLQSRSFNFGDLPCPPQSVMEQHWYKPEQGEPYRPFIAMPSQIRDMLWFRNCGDTIFTGYDPPRTLATATAMSPTTTNVGDPQAQLLAAPGPTPQDPGVSKTTSSQAPTVTPVQAPQIPQPKETNDPASSPKNTEPIKATGLGEVNTRQSILSQAPVQPGAVLLDPSSETNQASDPDQDSRLEAISSIAEGPKQTENPIGSNEDPQNETGLVSPQDPTQTQYPDKSAIGFGEEAALANVYPPKQTNNAVTGFDPSNVLPDQMSEIEGALNLSPQTYQGQPTKTGKWGPDTYQTGSTSEGGPKLGTVSYSQSNPQQPNNSPGNIASSNPQQPNHSPGDIASSNPQQLNTAPDTIAPSDPQPPSNSLSSMPSSGDPISAVFNNPHPGLTKTIQPLADYGAFIGLSGGHLAGSATNPERIPVTASGDTATVQDGSVVIGSQTVPKTSAIPAAESTMIAQAVSAAISDGLLIDGHIMTPTAAPQVTALENALQSNIEGAGGATPVDSKMIQSLAEGIFISGTSVVPEAPPNRVSNNPISLGASAFVMLGTNSVPLRSLVTDTPMSLGSSAIVTEGPNSVPLGSLVTTIADQAVTADLTALEPARYTLTPVAPGLMIGGTVSVFDSAGELVMASQSGSIEGASTGLAGTIIGGGQSGGPFTTSSSSTSQGALSTATSNETSPVIGTKNGGKALGGKADRVEISLLWKIAVVTMVAVVMMMYI